MTWLDRYRLREFAGSSFWLFPSLALLVAWLTGKAVLWFVPDPHWPRFDDSDMEGMRVSMAAFASSMLTFMVYAVSALLLAVQLASGQITPRLASSARAEASQCLITSGAGVPSGSSSTRRFAAFTRVSVVLAWLTVV